MSVQLVVEIFIYIETIADLDHAVIVVFRTLFCIGLQIVLGKRTVTICFKQYHHLVALCTHSLNSSWKLQTTSPCTFLHKMGRAKRVWYLPPMRAAKVQASLRIREVSAEPPLLTHTSRESRGTFRQKTRPLAPLNDWACTVKICHDRMLEDTNSLDGAQMILLNLALYSYSATD